MLAMLPEQKNSSAVRREGNHTEIVEEDKAVIEEQLQRLLASSYFNQSQRIPSFLKFVVRQAVLGQADFLKERTVGIEVFGKNADYDTASDSVVRVTAAELRKRIAQYYLEPGHEHELRISMPSGSYVPYFSWPEAWRESERTDAATAVKEVAEPARKRARGTLLLAMIVVAVMAGLALSQSARLLERKSVPRLSPVDAFWAPVLKSPDPVLFCMADQSQYPDIALRDSANLNHLIALRSRVTTVVIDDLSPLVTIGAVLQSNGKKFNIKGEGATNLMDLRNGPTIFIGAFDNAWTLRLTQSLRYHFADNPEMTEFGIVDGGAPAPMRWKVDRVQQISTNNYRDYAIVARFFDSTTGQLAVVAAGVGLGGTIAAGEFLANPGDMAYALRGAGNHKNMELVLSTQIINGEPGNPMLEAVYYW